MSSPLQRFIVALHLCSVLSLCARGLADYRRGHAALLYLLHERLILRTELCVLKRQVALLAACGELYAAEMDMHAVKALCSELAGQAPWPL